jgi:putative NADH-flavin reductase
MRILILGATGTIGQALVVLALARGHQVTAQTRDAGRARLPAAAAPAAFDPRDGPAAFRPFLAGRDAVVYALGCRGRGQVRFFSDTTRALLAAMRETGVVRLIAITGVGAGETRGHGGFLYDRVIFPLFTRGIYADKERQEALIRESGVDWTILRPAPFRSSPGSEPFHALTAVRPGARLSRVTPGEVAGFALDCAELGLHRGEAVFLGHGTAG